MTLIRTRDLAADGGRLDDPNPARELVLAEIARVAEACGAVLARLDSGALELRLVTGEIFHFGEDAVTRIA